MQNNKDTFEISPFHEKGKLNSGWSIWWRWAQAGRRNYDSNSLQSVFTFDDLNKFAQIYNGSPLGKVSNFMSQDKMVNRSKNADSDDSYLSSIDCLMLFRENCKPEWEDPKNARGGHFMIEQTNPAPEISDGLWTQLSYAIVGELWEPSPYITGLRMLIKNKQDKKYLKCEIWIEITNTETLHSNFNDIPEQQKSWNELRQRFCAVVKEITGLEENSVKWEPHFNDKKGHRK